eukprot:541064-Prymnesium_polylepis.1
MLLGANWMRAWVLLGCLKEPGRRVSGAVFGDHDGVPGTLRRSVQQLGVSAVVEHVVCPATASPGSPSICTADCQPKRSMLLARLSGRL